MFSQIAVKMLHSQLSSYSDPQKAWGYTIITQYKGKCDREDVEKQSDSGSQQLRFERDTLATMTEHTPMSTLLGLLQA